MRRIDIKREGCRKFGFVLLLAVMIPTVILGCETPGAVDSTLHPDTEPQIVDAPVLIPEPDDVIGGGVRLVVDMVGTGTGGGMVSVECDDECERSNEGYWFKPGRTVTVSAIPSRDSSFSRWYCTGVSCPIDTAVNPLQLSLYNEVDLTAIFRRVEDVVLRYGVELGTPISGGVAIASCEQDCLYDAPPHGSPIYILAEADEGYELEGWLCDGNCVDHDSGNRIGTSTSINPIGLSRTQNKTRIEPVFRTISAEMETARSSRNFVVAGVLMDELIMLTSEEEQKLGELWDIEGGYGKIEFMPESAEHETATLTLEQEQILDRLLFKNDKPSFGEIDEWIEGDFTVSPGELTVNYARGISILTFDEFSMFYTQELKLGAELVYGEPILAPSVVTATADLLKIEAGEYGRVNYAVINDASYGDMDTYRRIVSDSVAAWQTLNPWLDFQEVSSEMDPELDLVIRFVNTGKLSGVDGIFCRHGCGVDWVSAGLSYDEIFVWVVGNALMDEAVSFCRTQGYLPGQPAHTYHVVTHEIGHFLGLGHHWLESHLMWGGDAPSSLVSFDTLGYSIPDRVHKFEHTRGAGALNIDVSPEEFTALSARVSFLERILRQNYEVPEGANDADIERERLVMERTALEQELMQLKIRLNCGEADPEYTG